MPWWGWLVIVWAFGYLMAQTVNNAAKPVIQHLDAIRKLLIDIRDQGRR